MPPRSCGTSVPAGSRGDGGLADGGAPGGMSAAGAEADTPVPRTDAAAGSSDPEVDSAVPVGGWTKDPLTPVFSSKL